MIVGIILAAGESKRMGTLKQLLPWGETVLLQRVVEVAEASRLETVRLILGYRADEIASGIIVSSKTRILVNQDFRDGMSSSVKCGIRNTPPDAEAFMLMLGDQPQIGTNAIDALIDAYRASKRGITIPVFKGRRGHPVLFDAMYREELLSIDDQGAREVVRKHAENILEVSIDSEDILTDMDTPEEYRKALGQGYRHA